MKVIKWTNRYSNESGFVKSINTKGNHFVNTFDINEAKTYKKEETANTAITQLINFGEGENNHFEVIDNE